MTKRNTKNALISSVLALILCFSMLLGTTFAWFTDSVESATNIIAAGNLDIELYHSDSKVTDEKVTGTTVLFDDVTPTLWEPGAMAYEQFEVANEGTLALKYQFALNVANATVINGVSFAQMLKVAVVEEGFVYTRANVEAIAADKWQTLSTFTLSGNLEAKQNDVFGVVIWWQPNENDNLFNMNNANKGNVVSVEVGVSLKAAQLMSEDDSFGNSYDGGTEWYGDVDYSWYNTTNTEFVINSAEQLAGLAAIVNGTAEGIAIDSFDGKTVKLGSDINLNNIEWTPIGSAYTDHGFMGNFDGNGKTISNLYIGNIEPDADGFAYVGFFGVTEGAAGDENLIKDLTIDNVTINTTGAIAAAAIAYPYYTTLENITVCGDIAIKGGDYTSGALAYTRRCTTASNVTVSGNPGSYITGRDTVGGVISDIQTNGGIVANYSNFSVSGVTITGAKKVGGISGIICNQTLNGATVKNVVLVSSDAHVGIVSGSFDTKPNINNVTYENVTGTTSISGAPYGSGSNNAIVYIDGVEYVGNFETFKAYFDAKKTTINLACDITGVNANNTLTIAAGQELTLNLGGNKLSATANKTGNQELFLVKGNMTVVNGTIELVAQNNQEWNAMATIFDVTAGGSLTMENVTASVSGTDMNFIVHLNNWGTASLYVDNCDFTASYVAIRAFNSGYDMNTVTVKNTDFHGGRVFWVHNYTSEGKDDSTLDLDIYGNGNTTDNAKPVRFGFSNSVYYDINGNVIA